MALIQDLRVGTKVQVRGNHRYYPYQVGEVLFTDWCDSQVLVILEGTIIKEWFHAIQLKIVKDEGETKMTQKTKVKQEATPQNYVLMSHNYVSQVFTDSSTKGVLEASSDVFSDHATLELLQTGQMKLFKIEEVKLEVTEPSIKIVG